MALLPLALGAGLISGAEKANSSPPKAVTEKTLKRDDYTCRFCGFKAKQFQRTIACPEAGDPPFATVCTFCEQCLNLERAGLTGNGLLLWLPEMSQADLNHLVRAIYIARAEKGAMAAMATRALDALTVRRSEAKKRLGSDDPLLLATIFREALDVDEIRAARMKLEGIRLLPSEKYMVRGAKGDTNQMATLVRYWLSASGPYAAWPTGKWQDSFKTAIASAGHA